MGELDNERGEELDHDLGHLHRAHGEGHHTLLGTAVNEAGLQALNQLSLRRRTGEASDASTVVQAVCTGVLGTGP